MSDHDEIEETVPLEQGSPIDISLSMREEQLAEDVEGDEALEGESGEFEVSDELFGDDDLDDLGNDDLDEGIEDGIDEGIYTSFDDMDL